MVCHRDWCPFFIVIMSTNAESKISHHVDDIKIVGRVESEEAYLRLQWEVDDLGQWAEGFHSNKCVVYFVRQTRALGSVVEERELGVQV